MRELAPVFSWAKLASLASVVPLCTSQSGGKPLQSKVSRDGAGLFLVEEVIVGSVGGLFVCGPVFEIIVKGEKFFGYIACYARCAVEFPCRDEADINAAAFAFAGLAAVRARLLHGFELLLNGLHRGSIRAPLEDATRDHSRFVQDAMIVDSRIDLAVCARLCQFLWFAARVNDIPNITNRAMWMWELAGRGPAGWLPLFLRRGLPRLV